MALTSKQRAQLRGLAAAEDTIIQVGKGGINDNLVASVSAALAARELLPACLVRGAGVDYNSVPIKKRSQFFFHSFDNRRIFSDFKFFITDIRIHCRFLTPNICAILTKLFAACLQNLAKLFNKVFYFARFLEKSMPMKWVVIVL